MTSPFKALASIMLSSFAAIHAADIPLGDEDFLPTPERPIGWRGDGSGRFPGATPVTDWDLKTGSNVVWKARLPYFSNSSPIVVGGKVFTTAEPDLVICLDAKTGAERWRRHTALFLEELPEADREQVHRNCEILLDAAEKWVQQPLSGFLADMYLWDPPSRLSGEKKKNLDAQIALMCADRKIDFLAVRQAFADNEARTKKKLIQTGHWIRFGNTAATPASDGRSLIVKVGTGFNTGNWGYLLCYDLDGGLRWRTEIGGGLEEYGSPLILGGRVISQARADKQKGLAAFDAATGTLQWIVPAVNSGSSPIRVDIDGRPTVFHLGRFHDPSDGAVLGDLTQAASFSSHLFDYDTSSVQGDMLLAGLSSGEKDLHHPGRAKNPMTFRLSWKTAGKEVAFEQAYAYAPDGKPDTWGRFRPPSSPLLHGDCIYKQVGGLQPAIAVARVGDDGLIGRFAAEKPAIAFTKGKGDGSEPGAPNATNLIASSATLGGAYVFACASAWPSQFVVITAGRDARRVAEPVVDSGVVGNPFFQGGRMYLRGQRYLYCLGEPTGH